MKLCSSDNHYTTVPQKNKCQKRGNFTTKKKYVLSDVQQASNEIWVERIKSKKHQSKMFQGTEVQEFMERQSELATPPQRTTGQENTFFMVTFCCFLTFYIFYHFCNKNYFFINRISNHVTKTYYKI